jgi:hypothetical protein
MANDYRHNHYVPEWYQKKFLPLAQKNRELYYLDLRPGTFVDPRGIIHPKKSLYHWGFKKCFAENDLYTARFGAVESTEIEQHFFGEIDRKGRDAVEYYADFAYPWDGKDALNDIMMYMSTQKLRTPKGLGWLRDKSGSADRNQILKLMLQFRQLHCAIWAECVWLIADASQSETKFIISDHPVTVYNRRCGPRSQWCRGNSDPDIWLHGTHTIFPLALDKILILTNLSWVRNPYQPEVGVRPNPNPFRSTIFKVTDIQTLRHLTEQEVREINFIIKSRALRYVAAAKEEWLYPEKYITKSNWHEYGNGYLLMPDPRSVVYGGEIMIGHQDGSVTAFDEYGHRPWQRGYRGGKGTDEDWETFHRFQGEFARLFGPYRRGRAFNLMHLDPEFDDEEYHQYHLMSEEQYKKKMRKGRK